MGGEYNLSAYYQTNFLLTYEHHFSLTELENMIPYEREIYITLLNKAIDEKNLKLQQQLQGRGHIREYAG